MITIITSNIEITTFVLNSSFLMIAGLSGYFGFKSRKKETLYTTTESPKEKRIESDDLYKNLIENANDGFFKTNPEGNILYANVALAKILGYESIDELLKINLVDVVYKKKEDREQLLSLLNKSEIIKNYRITLKRKDKTDILVRINERVCKGEDGKPLFYEGSIQDITQQAKIEIARKKELDKLKEEKNAASYEASSAVYTSNVKSQFLAKMSHEIRTPMNSVLGFLTLIENGLFDSEEELKDFASSARISADSLLDIINNLLDISKIEAGKMELNHDEFSVEKEVQKAISITLSGAKEKGIKVRCKVDSTIPEKIYGDSTRFRQVLVNLLGNSIKYSKQGTIEVNAKVVKSTETTVKIEATVSDTGRGIPEDKLPELFKPYSQLKDKKWVRSEGVGLGLMICKEFVTLMGGDIKIESEIDKGTKVIFTVILSTKKEFLIENKVVSSANETPENLAKLDEEKIMEKKSEAEQIKRIPELEKPLQKNKTKEEKLRAEQIDEMLDSIEITDLIEDHGEGSEEIKSEYTPPPQSSEDAGKKRLLLVEDNPISQKVELKLLREAGYAIDPVSNGFDAIEAVKTNSFDLVLMDIEMEDMSGLEATRKIRELASPVSTIPIIAVTAHSSMKDREKCLASGMDDYIAKPINIRFLKMTIDQWLRKSRA